MISVIFYGRNDNHGYNLHKRASLSLNNIAELLSHEDDEILFVDWNTPPGLPTFIESIHDLLTDKAKELTKIIKVDFATHEKIFGEKTSKQTVEPVARNVAIVRSNPRNKWILSTNTDMIFIPKNSDKTLSDICSNLDDGFYELPRFSIPEILWETFDRLNPEGVMQQIKELRLKIDLDEIITAGPILRFDAPGDFQLCLRSQLFEIRGFDENMILGWHVDSNLCRRLNILNGETKSLEHELFGYHCEHAKTSTHFTASSVQNSLIDFFEKVDKPFYKTEINSWGLSNIELSEFKVKEKIENRYKILFDFARPPQVKRSPVNANYMGDLVGFPETHAIPYIIDALYDYPLNTKLLIFCHNEDKFYLYRSIFEKLGFIDIIHVIKSENSESLFPKNSQPKVIIFDLGFGKDDYDVSRTTHDEIENRFKIDQLDIIDQFLNFITFNSQNSNLYKTPIVSMNLETYDSGAGVFLKRWMQLPQVASNSRVRVGFLKKTLINRKVETLDKLRKKTIKEIDYLGSKYFKKSELNSNMLDKQGFQMTSHQILPYADLRSGLNVTRRGLMLQKSGTLELDLSALSIREDSVCIVELDRPRTDGSIYPISGFFKINGFSHGINFGDDVSESLAVKTVLNKNIEEICFGFGDFNYQEGHRFILRIVNLGIFKVSKLKKKLMMMRSSDLRSRYFLGSHWSYSNEKLKRWTTDSTFSINLNKENKLSRLCIAIEIKHYKNSSREKFINVIRSGQHGLDLKFVEIPRITRKRGRIIFIFVPVNCDSTIIIKSNARPYVSYELGQNENRTIYSAVGSLGYAEGNLRSIVLFMTFPFYILWVKILEKGLGFIDSGIRFTSKTFKGVLFWKT